MSNLVTDPIFTADTATGREEFGLFELMGSAVRGELFDLAGMAAHQRASLVTVLAILMHVLSRYVNRSSASSWASAWDALIGREALRITAPHETRWLSCSHQRACRNHNSRLRLLTSCFPMSSMK
jgi:hypothetical protein